MGTDVILRMSQRISALELAVFALCKTAADKDGLIAEIDRLSGVMQPPTDTDKAHFDEIRNLLHQYRQYTDIGKRLRPGQ